MHSSEKYMDNSIYLKIKESLQSTYVDNLRLLIALSSSKYEKYHMQFSFAVPCTLCSDCFPQLYLLALFNGMKNLFLQWLPELVSRNISTDLHTSNTAIILYYIVVG